MRGELTRVDREFLERILKGSFGGLSSVEHMVLSCGGIYIPHKNETQKVIYHIITTSDEKMPVKVVTGVRPKNILHLLQRKESLN